MVTKLSKAEPPIRKRSIWEDFGIEPGSARVPYITLLALPFAGLLGMLPAHLPYLFWPQYEEGSGNEPLWFALLVSVLFLAIPVVVATYGMRAAVAALRRGHRSAWLPALGFLAAFVLTAWSLLGSIFNFA